MKKRGYHILKSVFLFVFFVVMGVSSCGKGSSGGNSDGSNNQQPVPDTNPALIVPSLLSVPAGEEVVYTGPNPANLSDIMTLTFYGDGTILKNWTPDAMLGNIDCLGTWSYDGNSMLIYTEASVFGETMATTEEYGAVFTYDDGNKLSFYNPVQDTPNEKSIIGQYTMATTVSVTLGAIMDMDVESTETLIIKENNTWSSTTTIVTTGSGVGVTPGTKTENDNGTWNDSSNSLFVLGGEYYILLDDSLILNKMPDDCGVVDADCDGIFDECDDNVTLTDADCDSINDGCDDNVALTDADCDSINDGCDDNVALTDADCDGNVDGCVAPTLTDADCDGLNDGCDDNIEIGTDADCDGIGDMCDGNVNLADADCDSINDGCDDNVVLTDADCDGNVDGCVPPSLADEDCDTVNDGCDDDVDLTDADCDGNVDGCVAPNLTDADCEMIIDGCDDNIDLTDGDIDGIPDSCENCGTTDADCDGKFDDCDADVDLTDADCDSNIDGCVAPNLTDSDGDGIVNGCDACPNDANNNSDGDNYCGNVDNCPAVANNDQADADGDGKGNACDIDYPTIRSAWRIAPGSDVTLKFVGNSPTNPPDNPQNPATNEIQTLTFANNGKVFTKHCWIPKDATTLTEINGTGTWSYSGNQLTVIYSANMGSGATLNATEVYEAAFLYDDGGVTKLDCYSPLQDSPGNASTILGAYAFDTNVTNNISIPFGGAVVTIVSDIALTASFSNPNIVWNSTVTTVTSCTPSGLSGSMVCNSIPSGTTTTHPDGTLTVPDDIWLFELNGVYIIQTDTDFVMTQQ